MSLAPLLAVPLFAAFFALHADAAPASRPATLAPTRPAACMNNSRLFAHAAYLPMGKDQVTSCGHLLSTDTMLKVHRWAQT